MFPEVYCLIICAWDPIYSFARDCGKRFSISLIFAFSGLVILVTLGALAEDRCMTLRVVAGLLPVVSLVPFEKLPGLPVVARALALDMAIACIAEPCTDLPTIVGIRIDVELVVALDEATSGVVDLDF